MKGTCAYCGKEFTADRSTKKFCNSGCRARATLKHQTFNRKYPAYQDDVLQRLNDDWYRNKRKIETTMHTGIDVLNYVFYDAPRKFEFNEGELKFTLEKK